MALSPRRYAAERIWEISADATKAVLAVDRALRHYRELFEPGDVVFDLGANVGDRTAVFRELGARVVAVDPQPSSAEALRARFGHDPAVTVVEAAVAAQPGTYTLHIDENDTLSTLSSEWMDAIRQSGRHAEARWTQTAEVQATTMDALISEHGVPGFTKIDVEGFEAEVLKGLSEPIPQASLEFTAEASGGPLECVERLKGLGDYEFSFAYGDLMVLGDWISADDVRRRFSRFPAAELVWGDLYARQRS